MIRWFAVIFLTGCMLAQAPAPPAQPENAKPQTSAAGQAPVSDSGGAAVESGFPFDKFPEFSAIMVGSVVVGDTQEAHIYRSGKILRMQNTNGIGYYLTDLENFEAFGLSLTGCMHDTRPYMRAFPFTASRKDRKVEVVAAGKETVDGHECRIEDVTISSGGLVNPMQLRFWEAEDLQGFPIKVTLLKGPPAVIRYKNVVIGPQDPSLFIHPNSCKTELPEPPPKSSKPTQKKKAPAAPSANSSPK